MTHSRPLVGGALTHEQKIFLARQISQVGLSVRSTNCLIDAKINRLGDLVQMNSEELLKIRNLGEGCLTEIILLLADANLRLGLKLDDWDAKSVGIDPEVSNESSDQSADRNNLTRDQMAFLVLRLAGHGFSSEVRKFIEASKLKRVGDLAIIKPHRLFNKLGVKALNEIMRFLAAEQITLGAPIEDWDENLATIWEGQLVGESDRLRAQLVIDPHFLDKDITFIESELQKIAHLAFGLGRDRNAQILIRFLGLDGSGSKTLDQVSKEFGLTRERIRQVCVEFQERLREKSVNFPLLSRAHELVIELAPNLSSTIEASLREQKLTAVDFNCSGIAAALMQFGIDPEFNVARISNELVVGDTTTLKALRQATEVANLLAGSLGAVHIDHVARKLLLAPSRSLRDCLKTLLERTCKIEWLDADHFWFSIGNVKRRPLVTAVSKVLAVSPMITIAELHGALLRVRRLANVPPKEILMEFCRTLKFIQAEGEVIKAVPNLSVSATLAETEVCFYEILRRSGGAMHSDQLRDECLRQGMNKHTFYQYLTYSPIISAYASNVYSLVGANVLAGKSRRRISND